MSENTKFIFVELNLIELVLRGEKVEENSILTSLIIDNNLSDYYLHIFSSYSNFYVNNSNNSTNHMNHAQRVFLLIVNLIPLKTYLKSPHKQVNNLE